MVHDHRWLREGISASARVGSLRALGCLPGQGVSRVLRRGQD